VIRAPGKDSFTDAMTASFMQQFISSHVKTN